MSGQLHQVSPERSSVGFCVERWPFEADMLYLQLHACSSHTNAHVCMYVYIYIHVLYRDVIHVLYNIYIYDIYIYIIYVSWLFIKCLYVDKEEDFTGLRSICSTCFKAHKVDPIRCDESCCGRYPAGLVNLVQTQSDITMWFKEM